MSAVSPTPHGPESGEEAQDGGAQPASPQQDTPDNTDARAAFEYWGYLFKSDKTGTDRLKALLASIKSVIVKKYDPCDSGDIFPAQLAHFYRDMHGNYDQLFLNTPHQSVAFIYKSLGCLHSLQPQALSHTTSFTDPTVPALKTEGWIMWQTIQLLLGPEEHSSFLSEAVQRWSLRDPATGQLFPRILPRECFPAEPDKHMVAWHEGVSERLRHEAEEEARQRQAEAESAEVRRIRTKAHEDHRADDEVSTDSRGPALAYFRNPLYRRNDGRPAIIRGDSKRPGVSPRPTTVMDKGKDAATTLGHVVRNIGSPHLWDGRGSRSASHDRDRRRRSNADPSADLSVPTSPHASALGHTARPRRSRSSHRDRSGLPSPRDGAPHDDETEDENNAGLSPQPSSRSRHSRHASRETPLRRPRSHEPTPTQKEFGDYFAGYDHLDPQRRRNSSYGSAVSPAQSTGNGGGLGHGFAPSASPLFATQIARQPQPQPTARRPPSSDYRGSYPPRKSSSLRRPPSRPYDDSPDRHERDQADGGRASRPAHNNSRRPRFDRSPAVHDEGDDHRRTSRLAPSRSYDDYDPPNSGRPYPDSPEPRHRQRRSHGSDVSYSGPDERERDRDRDDDRASSTRPKQIRFAPNPPAVSGVDGRRYPNEAPWR